MDQYLFVGVVFLLWIIAGVVLIAVWAAFKQRLDIRKLRQMERFLMSKGKKLMVDTMCECMDTLPDKISEVKRTIEEG